MSANCHCGRGPNCICGHGSSNHLKYNDNLHQYGSLTSPEGNMPGVPPAYSPPSFSAATSTGGMYPGPPAAGGFYPGPSPSGGFYPQPVPYANPAPSPPMGFTQTGTTYVYPTSVNGGNTTVYPTAAIAVPVYAQTPTSRRTARILACVFSLIFVVVAGTIIGIAIKSSQDFNKKFDKHFDDQSIL